MTLKFKFWIVDKTENRKIILYRGAAYLVSLSDAAYTPENKVIIIRVNKSSICFHFTFKYLFSFYFLLFRLLVEFNKQIPRYNSISFHDNQL